MSFAGAKTDVKRAMPDGERAIMVDKWKKNKKYKQLIKDFTPDKDKDG